MACVYRLLNPFNQRFYIGSTQCLEVRARRHMREMGLGAHHNVQIQRDFNSGAGFVFEKIADDLSREEAYNLEQQLLSENADSPLLYNIGIAARGGDNLTRNPNRLDIVRRIKTTLKRNMKLLSSDERKKIWGRSGESNPMYGRTHTEEARRAISSKNVGRTYTCHPFTLEHRKKISECAKLRVGEKNSFYGKTHSDETKKKLSAMRTGNTPPNRLKVCINGETFPSMGDASKALGVPVVTIRHRCLNSNPKFSNWLFV